MQIEITIIYCFRYNNENNGICVLNNEENREKKKKVFLKFQISIKKVFPRLTLILNVPLLEL